MYIAGYCYSHGQKGKNGFNYQPPGTKYKAEQWIKEKLAGQGPVTFEFSGGKYRAHANGEATDYIYLAIKIEDVYMIMDTENVGFARSKANVFKGTLAQVKAKMLKVLQKQYGDEKITKLVFKRKGDNITFTFVRSTGLTVLKSRFFIVKV